MTRRLCLLGFTLTFAASGCGGSSPTGSSGARSSSTTTSPTATTPAATQPKAKANPKPKRKLSAAQRERVRRVRTYDRAFNAFTYHTGALKVASTEQFEDHPGYVIVRVPAEQFLCVLTPNQRRAAIKAYYELAAGRLAGKRVGPIKMDVAEPSVTAAIHHLYARVRNGVVTLTREGRSTRGCG